MNGEALRKILTLHHGEHAARLRRLAHGGRDRQRSNVSKLIWNIGETIEHLSAAWELQPGDLIYTGTPEGVAAVVSGDTLVGGVAGLGTLTVQVV